MSDVSQYPPPASPPLPMPPPASWGSRVLATILDALIAFALLLVPTIVVVVALVLMVESEDTQNSLLDLIFIPLWLLYLFLYYPLTMRRAGRHNGQTWGKQAVGIRVFREDTYAVTAETAIVREILVKQLVFGTLAACLLGIPSLLDVLWPLWDERNQAWHDKMASTLVIRAEWAPPVVYDPQP